MRFASLAFTVLFGLAGMADAAITEISLSHVNQSVLPGYMTFDMTVTGTGQFTGIQVFFDVSEGSIYQDPYGFNTAPADAFLGLVPTLAFDTFVGLGGKTANTSLTPVLPGGAVNIGGSSAGEFSTSKLDFTWAPPGASPVYDPTDYFVARLTLSETAVFSSANVMSVYIASFGEASHIIDVYFPLIIIDRFPEWDVAPGTNINLQSIWSDGSYLLEDALTLTEDEITGVSVDNPLFTSAFDGNSVDLGIDWAAARQLPSGTPISGTVTVSTANSGNYSWPVSATVPEPSSVALAGLAMVGLVGLVSRK